MRLEGCEEGVDAPEQAIVDDALILVGFNFVFAFRSLLVDLGLLCADEGAFVYVGVYLDIGVVAKLEGILEVKEGLSAWKQRRGCM